MDPWQRSKILTIFIFLTLTASTLIIMNVDYRYLLAPLFGIAGVFAYRILLNSEEGSSIVVARNRLLEHKGTALIALHILVLATWLLVPTSPSLYYSEWSGLSAALIVRGIVSLLYTIFVPGILLISLLDFRHDLSLLEIIVSGYLASILVTSTLSYTLFLLHINLNNHVFPALWLFSSLLVVLTLVRRASATPHSSGARPASIPSRDVQILLTSIVAILLASILAVNISWRVLLGGDLWTHAAQTAYFLQGEDTGLYPWTFHFLVASIHAIGGLPVINAIQLLQGLAIMPALALYVTVAAFMGRSSSRIPAFSVLFYAIFMGLGWLSYLWISATTSPTLNADIYEAEFIASQLTYDILLGLVAFRVVLVSSNIALTALIYGIRLIGGVTLSIRLVSVGSFIAVALMLQSHLLEAGFFTAVFAATAIFLWNPDSRRTLIASGIGTLAGFGWVFLVDSLSPPSRQLLRPFLGNFLLSGYEYALIPLTAGLLMLILKDLLSRRWPLSLDLLSALYHNPGANLARIEAFILRISILACVGLGVFFGLYTFLNQPFFGWQTVDTGYIPWNYYPIRIGIVTFFAILGTVLLLLRHNDLRRLFTILSLGTIAVLVGRLVNLFERRPQGFGENRVMDFLWIGTVVLAAYGLIQVAPRFLEWLGSSRRKRELAGALLIILILLTGASSFFLFVDAYVENSATPGLVPNSLDMAVINYIITHRDSVGHLLTAPTFETQYVIRKLTLNSPYGYSIPFITPSFFTATTLPDFLRETGTYARLRVFLTGHDASFLQDNRYFLGLWYLAYQSALVGTGNSFLLAPRMLQSPSGGTITALLNQQPTREDFLLISALGLSRSQYLLQAIEGFSSANTPYVILGTDPTANSTYQAALSWVQSTGGTLFVISKESQHGLFETGFFINTEENSTFSVVGLADASLGTLSFSVPVPFIVHPRRANATVLSIFQGAAQSSPLSYQKSLGTGQVILIMLRDYYNLLASNMFTENGRASYAFLPNVLKASGVPVSL